MRDRNFHPMFTTLLRVTFAQVMTKSKEVVFIGTRFTRAGWPIKTSSTFVSNKMKVDGKFGRKKINYATTDSIQSDKLVQP